MLDLNKPLITAHSGCMGTPPNSIDSVIAGIEAGADTIEVDIRATKDGVVVLNHDEHILLGSNGAFRIQDVTYQELSHFKKIVQLEEVLPIIKEANKVLNLDVKEDMAIAPMIHAVERFNMRDDVIITGCEKERAYELKRQFRPYQVLLNASFDLYQLLNGDGKAFIKQTFLDAISSSCCGINIHYQLCNQQLISLANRRCLPVLVWTIDDHDTMKQFLAMDVHAITTHDVEQILKFRDRGEAE